MRRSFLPVLLSGVVIGLVTASCLYCCFLTDNKSQKFRGEAFDFDWESVVQKSNIVPIAVVGSGPAGWSAALYGARAGIKTVVFEGWEPGGLLLKTSYVENWPGISRSLGSDIMQNLEQQARGFGVEVVSDMVESIDFSSWPYKLETSEGKIIHALTVIIATGANPRKLGVEGEADYECKGVSSCARCDALVFKDKEVIVVGGGDSAMEEALQLIPHVKNVTIIHRRDKFRAASQMQERITAEDKISVLYNKKIKKILGDGQKVTGVELVDTVTDDSTVKPIEGVFLAIGHIPNSELVQGVVDTDDQGYIELPGRTQETSVAALFAAGDVADHRYRQAGTASGDGIKAGIDAILFLQNAGFSSSIAKKLAQNMLGYEEQKSAESGVKDSFKKKKNIYDKKLVTALTSEDQFEDFINNDDRRLLVLFYNSEFGIPSLIMNKLQLVSASSDGQTACGTIDVKELPKLAKQYHSGQKP